MSRKMWYHQEITFKSTEIRRYVLPFSHSGYEADQRSGTKTDWNYQVILFQSTKKVSKFLPFFLSHSEIPRQLLQTPKRKCKNIHYGLMWPHKNGFLEINNNNTKMKRCFTLTYLIKLIRKERKGTSSITYATIRNWCNNKILHILTGRKIRFRFWHCVKLHKYV